VDEALEWDPDLIGLRAHLERRHLAALRELTGATAATAEPVDQQLAALIAADDGPSLSRYMARSGTPEQWREYLTLRLGVPPQGGRPAHLRHPRGCRAGEVRDGGDPGRRVRRRLRRAHAQRAVRPA
jgi:hypothetical protein